MEKRISGHTGLLALIGSPVEHSASPLMYNYSFETLGLDYAYVAFDVKEKDVKAALDAMRLFGMRGMNVTMPNKVEAATHVDELSPAAKMLAVHFHHSLNGLYPIDSVQCGQDKPSHERLSRLYSVLAATCPNLCLASNWNNSSYPKP